MDKVAAMVDGLRAKIGDATPDELREALSGCVPEYTPNPEGKEEASKALEAKQAARMKDQAVVEHPA